MSIRSLTTLAASIVLACAATIALADETTLIFGTVDSPTAGPNAVIKHPWAEKINKEGAGVLKIDVRDGPTLANITNAYSRVIDDVIQIGWALPSYVTGKFNLATVASLPFVFKSGEEGSVALWRLYKSGALDKEFDEVVPLYVVAFPPTRIHLAKKPDSLDSLKGLKIAAGTKLYSDMIAKLGGIPVSVPLPEYYQALQRGTVDGVIGIWSQLEVFKWAEVTSYHIDLPIAGSSAMVFMAKKKYDALSPAAKKLLDDNSGEAMSRAFGVYYDKFDVEIRDKLLGGGKHTLLKLTDDQEAKWKAAIGPVVDDWVKANAGGDKVLASFKELAAQSASK